MSYVEQAQYYREADRSPGQAPQARFESSLAATTPNLRSIGSGSFPAQALGGATVSNYVNSPAIASPVRGSPRVNHQHYSPASPVAHQSHSVHLSLASPHLNRQSHHPHSSPRQPIDSPSPNKYVGITSQQGYSHLQDLQSRQEQHLHLQSPHLQPPFHSPHIPNSPAPSTSLVASNPSSATYPPSHTSSAASSSRGYSNLEMSSYPSASNGHSHNHRFHQDLQSSPMLGGTSGEARISSPAPIQASHHQQPSHYYGQQQGQQHLPGSQHHTPLIGHSTPALNDAVQSSPYHTPMLRHTGTPEPSSPKLMPASAFGSTLKVLQWTPQHGDEGTQVTIVLDAIAINNAPSTQYSIAAFGPGSALTSQRTAVTRRFVVVFGVAAAPTKFARAQNIDGNGVAQSMSAGPNEMDAFVVLSTFVPARQSMGPLNERIMVIVRVVDESSTILEECIVGEWDAAPPLPPSPARRGVPFKRPADDLDSGREAPGLRSPGTAHTSPRRNRALISPLPGHSRSHLSSPQLNANRSGGVAQGEEGETQASSHLRHPPIEDTSVSLTASPSQPDLLRTSQIPASLTDEAGSQVVTFHNKALLKLQGDLNLMAMGWSNEEWTNRRRLIQFWRSQEGNVINATFRPIPQSEFAPNSIVISCIFRDDWNECFVTSVDTIYLLEALVGVRFTVEEKNRIRRNLEGFKPITVSKSKLDSEPFFKLIMGFPNPKPRNIEKDVKVFPWKILAGALKKIIGKYSATYTGPPTEDGSVPNMPLSLTSDFSQPQTPAMSPQIGGVNRFDSPRVAKVGSPHFVVADRFASHANSPNPSPHVGGPPARPAPPSSLQGSQPHMQERHQLHQSHGPPPSSMISRPSLSGPGAFGNGGGHSRPGSFDFNAILETSNFASNGGAYDRRLSYSGAHNHLFPSAEDYGISASFASNSLSSGGMSAPAMSHSRSFSEGPRRDSISNLAGGVNGGSFPAGASPFGSLAPHEVTYNPPNMDENDGASGSNDRDDEVDELASTTTS